MSTYTVHYTTTSFTFVYLCFFLKKTPTPEFYTLSLHDALPICRRRGRDRRRAGETRPRRQVGRGGSRREGRGHRLDAEGDRKSTRLNSSHVEISYAVFCLKKKK